MEEIKKYIKENYNSRDGGKTSECSEGNYDDVFYDGGDCREAHLLFKIGTMLEMELEEPHDPFNR